jgi:universal stress protein E
MEKLKSILLATDFRSASAEAAAAAPHLASAFGAQVSLLHVADVVPTSPIMRHEYQERASGLLQQVAAQLAAHNVAATVLPIGIGSRPEMIVRTADEVGADFILIGAGDLAAGDVFSAGSVAEAVMQHATKPVLAVRPGAVPVRFAQILCPVDHSAVSREGLRTAIRLAGAFGGVLVVLSVVPPLSWIEQAAVAPPLKWFAAGSDPGTLARAKVAHDAEWRAEFAQFLEGVEFGDVRWAREIRQGDPQNEIIAAAKEHHADVIVMGATGRGGLRRLLMGSVARKVLRHLPCALLTVKGPKTSGPSND